MATAQTQTLSTEPSLSLGNLAAWLRRNLSRLTQPSKSAGYYDSADYERQKTTELALARLEQLKLQTYQLP